MGSGHSKNSQVHSFHVDQNNEGAEVARTLGHRKIFSHSEQELSNESFSRAADNKPLLEAQGKIKVLQKQLGEVESENLDLQDRVQALEGQLEYVGTLQTVTEEPEDLTETIKAKDIMIETLNKEKEVLQTEFNKMKGRYRRRIKLLTTQVGEAKQETTIQLFELRDEITRLQEENQKLLDKQGCGNRDMSGDGLQGLEKRKIVLELSNQVSEQSDRIESLERELKEKTLIIDKLMSTESSLPEKSKVCVSKHVDIDVLDFKEREESQALRKLSLGLSHYKKGFVGDEEEERGFSGASRDSGIGSADKHGRKNVPVSDSKLSVLSDSDWESDEPSFQSKVRSAPPESKAKRTTPRGGGSASSSRTLQENVSDDDQGSLGNVSVSSKSKKSTKMSFLQKRFHVNARSKSPVEAFEKESSSGDQVSESKNHFFMTQSSTPTGSDADSVCVM